MTKIAKFAFRANPATNGGKTKRYKKGEKVTDQDHISQGQALGALDADMAKTTAAGKEKS